jgi:hypothetical protein
VCVNCLKRPVIPAEWGLLIPRYRPSCTIPLKRQCREIYAHYFASSYTWSKAFISHNAGSYQGLSFSLATHSDILSRSSCHCPFNLSLVSNPFEAVLYSFNDVSVVPQQLSTFERRPSGEMLSTNERRPSGEMLSTNERRASGEMLSAIFIWFGEGARR